MKLLIASDIHGSAYWCEKMLEAYKAENADRMLLLGDILYHGPRNDLPRDYAPKQVIEMLNAISDKILCVRGNCDTEVDQMVLDFSVLADYSVIFDGKITMYLTHGHHIDEIEFEKGAIVLTGHTHVPVVEQRENYTYLNVGSVSIPKENSAHSYMILENGEFLWKDLENGEVYLRFKA